VLAEVEKRRAGVRPGPLHELRAHLAVDPADRVDVRELVGAARVRRGGIRLGESARRQIIAASPVFSLRRWSARATTAIILIQFSVAVVVVVLIVVVVFRFGWMRCVLGRVT
jgi:hypothetical protein